MSRIKLAVVFFVCCTSVGFAQNNGDPQSQAAAPQPPVVQLSADVMTGLVEQKVLPQYPNQALRQGIQGEVVFNVLVDENGNLIRSEAKQGDALLVAASADALKHYRFRPYLQDGTPVRVQGQMGFSFTLTRNGDSTDGQVKCMATIP